MYNRATSSFEIKAWWRTTLWTFFQVCVALATSIYAKLPWNNIVLVQHEVSYTSDMHAARGCTAHSISHPKLALGRSLFFDPIQKIVPKEGVGALSWDYGTCNLINSHEW